MADRIEKRSHVAIQYVVHLRAGNPESKRIQRIVLAASGAKPVGEPEEVFLVNCIEHFHHRPLDDLVVSFR